MSATKLKNNLATYDRLAADLIRSLGSSRVTKLHVAFTLETTLCDATALCRLKCRTGSERFSRRDSYWMCRHEFAKRRLIEGIMNAASAMQIPLKVLSEGSAPHARADIVVHIPRLESSQGTRIAVEIKTGSSMDFGQIERLLWDNASVVLVRFSTGHVKAVRCDELAAFLNDSLESRIQRLGRLIAGSNVTIPCNDCYGCPVESCEHRKSGRGGMTMTDEAFNADFDTFLLNLYPTIRKAVRQVMLLSKKAEASILGGRSRGSEQVKPKSPSSATKNEASQATGDVKRMAKHKVPLSDQ